MTREILFRGIREDNGEWVEGSLLRNEDRWIIVQTNTDFASDSQYGWLSCSLSYDVKPETVGQCLCMPDKTGKIIYEGDITRHPRHSRPYSGKRKRKGVTCLVQWDDGQGGNKVGNYSYYHTEPGFNAYPVDSDLPEAGWGYDWSVFHDCEILGNKWNNPELLKKD